MLDLIGKAHAQVTWGNIGNLVNPVTTGGGTLQQFAVGVVNWIIVFAGILTVVYLVYGGILYITAGGDAEKATKGRTAVINAIIGIIIILLALVIVAWVRNAVTNRAF